MTFPPELQVDIAHEFPTLEMLQKFNIELRDNDIPLDRIKPVARMLKASRDAREVEGAELAQERELRFHHGSGMDAVNRRNDEGATSLHIAILCYNAGKVRKLLASGAKPDLEVRPAQRKVTFIAVASLASRLEEIDVESELNETIVDAIHQPLDSATKNLYTRVLIEHAGENALTLAISYEAPFEIIEMLVKHCALHCPELLRQADARGNPPLLLAAASSRHDAVDVARLLLASGAALDVDQTNGLERTALVEAVRRGNTAMVELLLQAGASCDIADNHGYDATAHAVLCEWPALHHLMIEFQRKGATKPQALLLDAQCLKDFSLAAARGQQKVVRQMLTDQKQRLCGGKATLTVDQQSEFAGFVQAGLLVAIHVPNNGAVIRCLTNDGAADADLPDVHGVRLWQKATDKEALEALLEKVFKTDTTNIVRASSQAILAEAARHGSVHYACLALDAGAGIETPDPVSRRNALMTAVERNDRLLIVELLKRGASMLGNAVAVPGNALAAPLVDCALATARDVKPMKLACELVVFIVDNCPDRYVQPHHAGLLLDLAVAMKLPGLATTLIKDGKLEPRWFQHRANSLLVEIVHAGSPEFASALLQGTAPLMQLLNADNGDADRALKLASGGGKQALFHLILLACKIDLSTAREVLSRRLMWAVTLGCTASCELILAQGGLQLPPAAPADENPLILAVQRREHKVIEVLLAHGAHACARHSQKASALSRAIEADDGSAVNIMLNQDRHPHELAAAFPQLSRKAAAGGKHRAFALLVMKSRELVLSPAALTDLLQHAVTLGSLPACVSLLERGADAACSRVEGQSLLARALTSTRPNLDIVRLLFKIRPWASSDGMETYEPDTGLDFTEIVRVLAATDANEAHIIEWMALMFCAIRRMPFSTMTDMRIKHVGRLFEELARSGKHASSEAMQTRALFRARELAASMPDREAILDILDHVARILDLPNQ
nr:ankyrin repeat domain-containing protein [uncultured Noviherbaspirillum sp.]